MLNLSGCDQQVKGRTVSIHVSQNHPLIKLALAIPWEKLAEIVLDDLKKTTTKGYWWLGRNLYIRTHLGAYLLQKMLNKKDREIAQDLSENAAFRVFAGEGLFKEWSAPHSTKIEEFRNRLSPETHLRVSNLYAQIAVKMGFAQAQHVDMDSTVQAPGMTYPSDAKLMTQLVERCLKVTNWVKRKTKSIVPKDFFVNLKEVKSKAKGYFFLAKNATKDAKQKCFAEIHRVAKREIYNCLDIFSQLGSKKIEEMPWNIRRSYDQIASQAKRYMLDVAHFIRTGSIKPGKTLSFHLNDVACIVKNKVGKPYEFGRVFQVGRLKGNFVWSAPHTTVRMDDKSALPPLLEVHERLFDGIEIESCATDKSYYSLVNEQAVLEALSTTGIMHLGYQYEDVNDDLDSQLKDHRAGIEAIIGHIKSGGQLGKSRMKSDEGNLSAGYAAMGGFNLRQLMRYLVKS